MSRANIGSAFVGVVFLLLGAYVFSLAQRSADLLLVQATTASAGPVRLAARIALRGLDECPVDDFRPTTPIGFVVAGWGATDTKPRYVKALNLLLAAGCSSNAYSERGLTPLHSAVLLNRADAARALLDAGANAELVTEISAQDQTSAINLNAREFAEYLDEVSGEDRSAVIAVLNQFRD